MSPTPSGPTNATKQKKIAGANKKETHERNDATTLMRRQSHLGLEAFALPERITLQKRILNPFLDELVLDASPNVQEFREILLRVVLLLVLDCLADEFEAID